MVEREEREEIVPSPSDGSCMLISLSDDGSYPAEHVLLDPVSSSGGLVFPCLASVVWRRSASLRLFVLGVSSLSDARVVRA